MKPVDYLFIVCVISVISCSQPKCLSRPVKPQGETITSEHEQPKSFAEEFGANLKELNEKEQALNEEHSRVNSEATQLSKNMSDPLREKKLESYRQHANTYMQHLGEYRQLQQTFHGGYKGYQTTIDQYKNQSPQFEASGQNLPASVDIPYVRRRYGEQVEHVSLEHRVFQKAPDVPHFLTREQMQLNNAETEREKLERSILQNEK
jgi:hypothetical protein